MSRRRRAAVLIGLSLILGALAASDVSGREAALRREVGPVVPVLVVRTALSAGARIGPGALAVRHVPSRYAPAGAYRSPGEVTGLRAAVAIPAGADLDPSLVDDGTTPSGPSGPALRAGERVAQVVAIGPAQGLGPGARVDVLVTREGAGSAPGSTTLALEDVEVLAVTKAPDAGGGGADAGQPRVALDLRVSVRQAVYLAAAQSFARELRVLPRAPGDRRRGAQGLRVGGRL
ncbi:MAG: pilus assembly protein CpaB [Solirubrobacteraceae bacterium]|jgi:pilus assembly protein CpaB|nr:pilus assembly protein CpaB [Solirubrobacteraceae bacterium]